MQGGNFRQLADVAAVTGAEDAVMEVRIWLDQTHPPVGRLGLVPDTGGSGAGEPATEEFIGWLGLLRALSDVLESTEETPAHRGRGEGPKDQQSR